MSHIPLQDSHQWHSYFTTQPDWKQDLVHLFHKNSAAISAMVNTTFGISGASTEVCLQFPAVAACFTKV